jgi:hypothetical protein
MPTQEPDDEVSDEVIELQQKCAELTQELASQELRIQFLELWMHQFQELVTNRLWPRDQSPDRDS